MTTSLKTFSVSNRARDVERRTTLNPIEPASRVASPRTAAWVNTCARFEHPRTANDDGCDDDMKVFILMHIIRLRDRRSHDRDRCSLPTPTRALTLGDLALDAHATHTYLASGAEVLRQSDDKLLRGDVLHGFGPHRHFHLASGAEVLRQSDDKLLRGDVLHGFGPHRHFHLA
eukprot:CAMPEP_0179632244 /NCGR_PEP_ID=MMETSP0932-20121108/6828_1 /TAXON_ID=548131 ORGANISM="Ostreococcus mediterraneus, Strain clade-D-RCC2596" /NCGR_SAMPLE_ID=MMETSP0932 /ASSEMBLY_ACC=CAM_ASM_000582 /LENGTH=172 /DNA_ID=CAMNT_0021501759 /DNA_START=633 /DNA_END=1148 /DNA_ORIENTATION=-